LRVIAETRKMLEDPVTRLEAKDVF
jgi:hypothetical protein